ncbi:hypothetical protein JTB14_009244 [Gonioctena quinquepunctata]|nr:hypothetical protein JTB14_009244 [Gonioctena quinquepunctata]
MKRNCLTPYYDPDPFVTTGIRCTKITAKTREEFIQRNSSFFKKIKANGANSSRTSDYPSKSFGKTHIKYQNGNYPHTLEIEEGEVPSDKQFPNKPVCTAEIEKTSRSRPLRQTSRPKYLEDFERNGHRIIYNI